MTALPTSVDRSSVKLTAAALAASATVYYPLTPGYEDRLGSTDLIGYVRAQCWADKSGTFSLDESHDLVTWVSTGASVTASASTWTTKPWTLLTKRYWRWTYVNDGTAQATFAFYEDRMTDARNIDIGDVDVLTIAAGDNNIGNVDVASIAAGDNNIGNVDVATIAAGDNNIGNVDVASIAAGDNNIGNVDVLSIAAGDNNIGNMDIVTEPATAADTSGTLPAVVKVVGGSDGTNIRVVKTDTSGELQVDVLSIAAGDNNVGNVDIASIAAGDTNIGNVDIVTEPATAADTTGILPGVVKVVGGSDGTNIRVVKTDTSGELQVDVLSIAAGDNNIGNVDLASSIPAGTNLMGKVGIDQTTPGTTNGVQVNAALPAGDNNIGNVDLASAIPAGANIVGKVGIDQTTPGTTNGVQVNAALPAGDNNIGNVDLASAIPAGANIIGVVGIDQTTPGTTNGVQVVAALPTGANAIGKLAANDGVDIGNVDVASIAAGDNNIGNVDIASAIPAGTNVIGALSGGGIMIGATPTATTAVTADVDALVAAVANLRLVGYSVKETAGAAATLSIVHGATGAAAGKIVHINLAANESTSDWMGPEGIAVASGLSIDWLTGAASIILYTKVVA